MTSQIDLSKYVGKKVRVTFRGMGDKQDVIIEKNRSTTYPYFIHGTALTYTSNGANNGYMSGPYDIIYIEEIEEINEIQELENKVKELQAQIDRLKKKEVPKIKCIEVTRTIVYDPESYLQFCFEDNITPSQSGFLGYIEKIGRAHV